MNYRQRIMRNEMENFFISVLAFYEIKFRYIFEYIYIPIISIQFPFFFFFPRLKNRTEFENAIFTPHSLFIFVRGILRISIQLRILLHLTSFQTRFPRKRILTRENVIPSFQLISTCRITLNFDCATKNHWKLFPETTQFQKLDIFKKEKRNPTR